MPHSATRKVKAILTLMEDIRDQLCFITVSLPDEDLHRMAGTDIWPQFQRRYVDLLTQHLKRNGDVALVVGVVEIGDERAKRTGRPMPHMHVVCTGYGKRLKGYPWLVCPQINDELIALAAAYSGLPAADRRAAGNIQQVKKSVKNYVSKYLTKQSPIKAVNLDDGYEALIPHQWWNRSQEAVALLEGHLFKLPQSFCAFLVARRKQLEDFGLGRGGNVTIGFRKTITGDLPVEVFRFQFVTPEALHQALELYALWCQEEMSPIPSGGGGMVT